MFEDEHSSSHGYPLYVARSGAQLAIDINETIDVIDEAVQEFDHKLSEQKNPQRGVIRVPKVSLPDGTPVPTGGIARAEFYKQMAENITSEPKPRFVELEELGVPLKKPAGGWNPADYGDGV